MLHEILFLSQQLKISELRKFAYLYLGRVLELCYKLYSNLILSLCSWSLIVTSKNIQDRKMQKTVVRILFIQVWKNPPILLVFQKLNLF
jgi:hypothetical protein